VFKAPFRQEEEGNKIVEQEEEEEEEEEEEKDWFVGATIQCTIYKSMNRK